MVGKMDIQDGNIGLLRLMVFGSELSLSPRAVNFFRGVAQQGKAKIKEPPARAASEVPALQKTEE